MEKVKVPPKKMAYIAIGTAWILFQLYLALVSPLHPMLQSPVHLMFALFIVFLNNPADKKSKNLGLRFFDIPIYAGIVFYPVLCDRQYCTPDIPRAVCITCYHD